MAYGDHHMHSAKHRDETDDGAFFRALREASLESPIISHRAGRPRSGRRRAVIVPIVLVAGMTMVFAGRALGDPEAPGDRGNGNNAAEADTRDPIRIPDLAVPEQRQVPPGDPQSSANAEPTQTQQADPAPFATTTRPPAVPTTAVPAPPPPPAPAPAPPAPPPAPAPIDIHYSNFNSIGGLQLNGAAVRSGTALRLTAPSGPDAGSAFSTTPIDPRRSFSTSFRIWMHNDGADGVAFVLQSESPTAIGEGGWGLGFGDDDNTSERIRPSVAIEFDTMDNDFDPYSDDNHIAVTRDGVVTADLDHGVPGFTMWDCGGSFLAWVEYNASTHRLSVYAGLSSSRPANPVVSVTIDVAAVLGSGTAYAGFTASKGYYIDAQDILYWRFLQ